MSAAEEFDATAAAATAMGEDPSPTVDDGPSPDGEEAVDAPTEDGPPDPQDADRGGADGGPIDTLRERLLATEPNPPLESEELSTWDAEHGGRRRMKRGLYKALGTDGATALEDILLGALEEFGGGAAGGAAASTESSTESDGSDDGSVPLAEVTAGA